MTMFNLVATKEFVERNTNIKVEVKNVWTDFGTGKSAKTLVSVFPEEYILLSPMELKSANGFISKERATELVREINNRGW